MEKSNSKIEENDYSMYQFLKKRPSVLFALITFMVSLTTVIINYCYNEYFNLYFYYWGFTPETVKLPSINNVQLFFSQFVSVLLYQMTFTTYVSRIDVFWGIIEHASVCSPQLKAIQHEAITKVESNDSPKEEINTEMEIIASIELLQSKKKEAKHHLWVLSIFAILACFVLNLLNFRNENFLHWSRILFCSVLSVVSVILYCALVFATNMFGAKVKFKLESASYCLAECRSLIQKNEYYKNNRFSLSFYLSNSRIKVLLRVYILSLSTIIFTFSMCTDLVIKDKREFLITEIDGNHYAIIFQDGNTYYLNEISIDDDNLYISTTAHLVKTMDTASYENRRFNHVIERESVFVQESDDESSQQLYENEMKDNDTVFLWTVRRNNPSFIQFEIY